MDSGEIDTSKQAQQERAQRVPPAVKGEVVDVNGVVRQDDGDSTGKSSTTGDNPNLD